MDTSSDYNHLALWQKYNERRVKEGFTWAVFFFVVALIAGGFFLRGQSSIRLASYADASNIETPIEALPDVPCPSSDAGQPCSSWSVFTFLIRSLVRLLKDVLAKPERMTAAWFFRWLTFVIIFFSTLIFYRAHLSDHHRLVYDSLQAQIAKKIRWSFIIKIETTNGASLLDKTLYVVDQTLNILGILLTFSAPIVLIPFAAYIVIASLSRSLDIMFVDVTLASSQVWLLGAIFAAIFAYIMVQIMSVVDTYKLMFIALVIIGLGFSWGFSVAETSVAVPNCGDYWYCHSISTTGILTSSGIIFTLTMLAIGYFLLLYWHDIFTYLQFIRDRKAQIKFKPSLPPSNRLEKVLIQFDERWHWTQRLLVVGSLCMIGVGIFPTIKAIDLHLNVIHFLAAGGGTLLLIFAGKYWLTLVVLRDILPKHFHYTTWLLFIFDVVMIGYYFIIHPHFELMPLNLTGLELCLLVSMGLWYYGLADNILDILNELEYTFNEQRITEILARKASEVTPPHEPVHDAVDAIRGAEEPLPEIDVRTGNDNQPPITEVTDTFNVNVPITKPPHIRFQDGALAVVQAPMQLLTKKTK